MRRNKFLGKLADFTMNIFMYLSTVLFETGNITKAFFSEGGGGGREGGRRGEVYITLPYQMYSSYLRDYMANYIWNITRYFLFMEKFSHRLKT